MKRLISVLFVFLLFFSFCACSNVSNINNEIQESAAKAQETAMTNINTTNAFDSVITVKVKDKTFSAHLYNNETAQAFANMLPITIDMNELHGNEKYYNLSKSLPMNGSHTGKINNGDIMLYGSDCIVLFYDSFSTNYKYTEIGYIENPKELAEAVGSGNITVSFEK